MINLQTWSELQQAKNPMTANNYLLCLRSYFQTGTTVTNAHHYSVTKPVASHQDSTQEVDSKRPFGKVSAITSVVESPLFKGFDMGRISRTECKVMPKLPPWEDVTEHRGEGLLLKVHRRIDFTPMVHIEWTRSNSYEGRKLKLFRSSTGFCAVDRPQSLSDHGQMILETVQDGQIEQQLGEGTYYYTFLYHYHGRFLERHSQPLRFQIEVPSLDVPLKRIADWQKVEELRHQQNLSGVVHNIERSKAILELEAVEKKLEVAKKVASEHRAKVLIEEQLRQVKERIETELGIAAGKNDLLKEVRADPRYNGMKKNDRNAIDKAIEKEFPSSDERRFQP